MIRSSYASIKLRNTILILLLLAAFALRLYRLDHQEIWGDEAHSAYVASLPLPVVVSPRTETNPPLYHFLLYLWVGLTGSSVFALRFLSLVLGVLTVPLVYRLARLAFGELVGLLAALLCTISPFLVYYSQEARMYALATFSTTLSMLLLARIVSGQSWGRGRSGFCESCRDMEFNAANHPHRRYNPLTGEWVPVSPRHTQRPWQGQVEKASPDTRPAYDPDRYLCTGNERAGGNRNPELAASRPFLPTSLALYGRQTAICGT